MNNWQDIRQKARRTRADVDIQKTGATATHVINALVKAERITVAAVPSDSALLRGARASWRGRLRLMAVDNALSDEERAFAMAHELGHYKCHSGLYECRATDIDEVTAPVVIPVGEGRVWGYSPRQAREIEANIFAAELLAPSAELHARFLDGMDSATLAAWYRITPTCMLNQLLATVLGGATVGTSAQEDGTIHKASHPLDMHQKAAAETALPRVLVDAGPGTGKTHTLVARSAHLLRQPGVSAAQILILTFSNRAAEELRERLRLLDADSGAITIATFHGFALDTLRQFAPQAGLPFDVRVVDDADAALLLRRALPDLDIDHYKRLSRPEHYLPAVVDAASCMKDKLLTPDALYAAIDAECSIAQDEQARQRLRETGSLIMSYNEVLKTHGVVDYGGIIEQTVHLLHDHPGVAEAIHQRCRHILVDEYQDTNHASAVLLQAIAQKADSVWVVGDVRQGIYRFRGASPENLEHFGQHFPGATRMALHVNYRSAAPLVSVLNTVAATMTGTSPEWVSNHSSGDQDGSAAVLVEASNHFSEVAGIISDLHHSITSGRVPEEHAVLCATHGQAAVIASALEGAGIITTYLGNFFFRSEVKDMLAFLELCRGPDGAALLRLSTWSNYLVSEERAEAVIRAAQERDIPFPAALRNTHVLNAAALNTAEQQAMHDLAQHIAAVRYYPDPTSVLLHYLFGPAPYLRTLLQNGSVRGQQAAAAIFQLIMLARGFQARPSVLADGHPTDDAFLSYVRRLIADGENGVFQATSVVHNAVNVLTVHASKGTEFPIVYVPNLGRGRFPVHGSERVKIERPQIVQRDSSHRTDDDYRLFFVAVSRAKERLVMSRALQYGNRKSNPADVLELIRTVGLPVEKWSLASMTTKRIAVEEATAPSMAMLKGSDLSTLARCPREYYYRHLGLRSKADMHEYRRFGRVVRDSIAWLRTALAEAQHLPSWLDAEAAFEQRWADAWVQEMPLELFYRPEALQLYRNEYDRLSTSSTTNVRLQEEYVVDLDGQSVSVRVDAVEQRDGRVYLIWEPVTSKKDDASSVTVALYSTVAQTVLQGTATAVEIRYLDGTAAPQVSDTSTVLEHHRAALRELAFNARALHFPAKPTDPKQCTRCSFSFVCPGMSSSQSTD